MPWGVQDGYGVRRALAAAGLCAALFCPRAVAASETHDPAAVLRASGLQRVDRLWLAPLEIELRQDLAELPKRRERIIVLERGLHERIEVNRRAWQANQPAMAALQQTLGRLGTDDPRRETLQQQLDALQTSAPPPEKLSARGDVRSQVVAWNRERNSLATAVARIRQAVPQLQELYQRLSQSTEMVQALARLGEGHRLGPQRSYRAEIDRLAEYERLAYTPWTPVYWQGRHLRFTALVADRRPLTFCWIDSGGEPATLTHTAADAAGIAIPDDAPRETIFLEGERRTTGRRIALPELRIGKLVLRDVTVLVLPPEAEDWGCRLGRDALPGHSVKLEPERLRLWIDAG